MIKLDHVIRLKQQEVDEYREKCDKEIKKIRESTEDKLILNEKKMNIEREFIAKKTEYMKSLIAS